jgi:hypothetical protein
MARVSRSGQMLLCRKSRKAVKERPSWPSNGLCPSYESGHEVIAEYISQRGERGEEKRHENPKWAPLYKKAGWIWRGAGILN